MAMHQKMGWPVSTANAFYSRMELNTRESGTFLRVNEMAEASRSGLMGLDTKDTGKMTRPMDAVDSYTPMETCTKGSGRTTNLTVMGCIYILMELSIKVNGLMTSRKDTAWRLGLMEPSTKARIRMA